MALMYVYRPGGGEWETHSIENGQAMPFAPGLSLRAFAGMSRSPLLWTDERLLSAYARLCRLMGEPPRVRYGFRRVGEGAHVGQSGHHAGLALDLELGAWEYHVLGALALKAGFSILEAPWLTPGWLHAEVYAPSSNGAVYGGYPFLGLGAKGVHAFVLQDALLEAGFYFGGLNGTVTEELRGSIVRFQREARLPVTGRADAATWPRIMRLAHDRSAFNKE